MRVELIANESIIKSKEYKTFFKKEMSKNSLFKHPIGRSVDITLVNFHGLFKLATERINSNPVHISLHAKNFFSRSSCIRIAN